MNQDLLTTIATHPGPLCLCTVMKVLGSAPRHAGSKMLVGVEGRLLGSVGGGKGEAMVLAAAQEMLAGGLASRVLDLDFQGLDIEGPHMVCGGTSHILLERLDDRTPYEAALPLLLKGESALLIKRVAEGRTACLNERGAWEGKALTGVDLAVGQDALRRGQSAWLRDANLWLDPLLPREQLLILGGGHVGQALAALAPGLGLRVTVGDDRPEYLDAGRFPEGVSTLGGTFTEIVARFPFNAATLVAIITRGHLADLECVRAVLNRTYRYAGFMGSRRKARLILDQVKAEGFDPEKIAALRAPIGLELGAETPAELAVAIAAELIAARRHPAALALAHAERQARRQTP